LNKSFATVDLLRLLTELEDNAANHNTVIPHQSEIKISAITISFFAQELSGTWIVIFHQSNVTQLFIQKSNQV
jgi:hypothetical protein